ncbi:hypothetical protein [Actinoplanes subtropicus]|nr:hypothetical protein [Actinoplanes subtropicus]
MRWAPRRDGGVEALLDDLAENEESVRAAAYGCHPEPAGWRDETGG